MSTIFKLINSQKLDGYKHLIHTISKKCMNSNWMKIYNNSYYNLILIDNINLNF